MVHFGPENDASPELLICFEDFSKIFFNEMGQEAHENYINGFCKKILVLLKWGIGGPNMKHPHNSGFALKIFLKGLS